jgi:type I restriction enzyme S subunit
MKNEWKELTVGEILQLEYGKPLDESDRKSNGRFPVYGANGEKDRTDRFYCEKPSIIVGRKARLVKSILLKRNSGRLM